MLLGLVTGSVQTGLAAAAALGVTDPKATDPEVTRSITTNYQLLTYEASIAGAPAGVATVAIARSPQRYRIAGQARATGLLDAFNPWRARFWSTGDMIDSVPTPRTYRYVERGRDKRRDVTVDEGLLTVIKNGKQRPTRPALPGLDVLTALFVEPRCTAALPLHTGRHGYQLSIQPPLADQTTTANRCKYQVIDEDQDSFAAELQFGPAAGYRVPTRITVSGTLSGSMQLTDSKTVSVACSAESDGLTAFLCGLAE